MSAPWWAEAFGPAYLDLYPHRDLAAARAEARFLVSRGLAGRVLDVCCGWGRHMIGLRELGLDVVGVDWSIDLLARARCEPDAAPIRSRLVRGDARVLPFQDRAFDGAISMFSSFGYFSDEGDRRVLAGIARVLRPGGLAILDLANPEHVRASLVPRSVRQVDGAVIEEERELGDGGRRVRKRIRIRTSGGDEQCFVEDVRLYEPAEIEARAAEARFRIAAVLGGYDGRPWSPSAQRQIVELRV